MKTVYRNNIVHRMGGEFGFDFLVVTYCENILDDESLDRFFANFDLKSLTYFQKELLLVSFLEPCEETNARRKRVMFRNEMMGLDRSHFPMLEEHFVAALDDCFITGLDYELCKAYFAELIPVFKECTSVSMYRHNIVERMGGEATFEFLIVSYCERIEGDIKLHRFFQGHDLHDMTHLQKELISMAFLQPSAENDIEVLKRRVTSMFSPMFALGMNDHHFEIMEKHFSAALFECLSRPAIIQTCSKLFSNLITFFEDNAQSSANYDDDEVDDEEDEDETLIIGRRYSSGTKASQLSYNEGMSSHIAKRISAALDVSDRTQSTDANGSSHATRSLKSSDFDGSSSLSFKSADFDSEALSFKSTEFKSESSKPPATPKKETQRRATIGFTSPLATPKKIMGRPKMIFSWKSPTLRRMKKSVGVKH